MPSLGRVKDESLEEDLLRDHSLSNSTKDIGVVLLSDEEAKINIQENQKWMLGGYLQGNHREHVQKAFKTVDDDIDISEGANGEVEDLVAGPAVRWALLGNVMTWTTFVVVTCTSKYLVNVNAQGIAQKPAGGFMIFGILIWIAFTVAALIPEYKALMYCLPTQSVCIPRKAEGKGAWMGFNKWMLSMFVISVILHADIYTTAIFMGRIWASTSVCPTLDNMWALAIHQSFLRQVPIINVLTYFQLCALAWCLMVAQFIYALSYSIPISPNVNKGMDVSSERVSYAMVDDKQHVQKYDTIMKKDTGHGRCVQALSESGRMCSLNWQDDAYLAQAERGWDCQRVHDEMRRTNIRFLLFCIQATFIPNLQITFLGIQKSNVVSETMAGHDNGSADYLTILSFTVSFLSGLHYIYYEFGSVGRHKKYIALAIKKQKEEAVTKKNGRKHWDAQRIEDKVKFSVFTNRMFTLGFSLAFCFILVKASMVIFFCDSGIWNAHFNTTTFSLKDGCVAMSHIPWETWHCTELNATDLFR